MDEATSSIDTRTEIKIQEAFQKNDEGVRVLFSVRAITRLSTNKEADIIFSDEGWQYCRTGQITRSYLQETVSCKIIKVSLHSIKHKKRT